MCCNRGTSVKEGTRLMRGQTSGRLCCEDMQVGGKHDVHTWWREKRKGVGHRAKVFFGIVIWAWAYL